MKKIAKIAQIFIAAYLIFCENLLLLTTETFSIGIP